MVNAPSLPLREKYELEMKKEIKRPIFNIDIDSDNNPYNHPYYIIDPFDVNHNPGKPLKFKSKLFPKY